MTDATEVAEARAELHDAIQKYACLTMSDAKVLTSWHVTGEFLTVDDQLELLLLTSPNMTSWSLVGQMVGAMRIASEALA